MCYTFIYKGENKMPYIKTKEQARQYGIDYQKWASERSIGYGELLFIQNKLTTLAKKFGLVKEFKENGII
jgi:hypothetical protein